MSLILTVLTAFAGWGLSVVIWGDFLCTVGHALNWPRLQAVAHNIFMELKPFFWSMFFVALGGDLMERSLDWWDWLGVAIVAVWGLLVKDRHRDEDDRWKRRREKLAEAVTRRGAKLVVVPAGSPS